MMTTVDNANTADDSSSSDDDLYDNFEKYQKKHTIVEHNPVSKPLKCLVYLGD